MDAIDNNAYQTEGIGEPIVAIVGDATTPEFYAQVKVEKWDNEANFSLRYDEPVLDHTVDTDGVVEAVHEDAVSRIYATTVPEHQSVTQLRRVFAGATLTAIEGTAEYELFDRVTTPGTAIVSHYQVSETAVALLDLMPASMHIELDANGNATDFNYADKPYHAVDVAIPSCGPTKVVRYRTPYAPVANPMFIDSGVEFIMVRWHGSQADLLEPLMAAVESTLQAHGVETDRHGSRAKVYFKHEDRWVKCFSVQPTNGGLYGYFNVASAYNKIYDFYRPDVVKDVRDEFAYGVQAAHPELDRSIVNEIMVALAANAGLPMVDKPLTSDEVAEWQRIQSLQDSLAWVRDGQRPDANWYPRTAKDGIEFEIVLPDKPATNLVPFTGNVPKNVIAFVQAPFDYVEMVNAGNWRDPDVAGSLAIYHADKAHNEYKTGKVAHIYRPIAHDATGLSVFCDFAELNGLDDGAEYDLARGLTVCVPQAFLDAAVYPVTVDPTVGYSTVGASTASALDSIQGTLVTPSSTGWLHSINAYTDTTLSTSWDFDYAIYDTAGNFNCQVQSQNNTSASGTGGLAWVPLLLERPWHLTGSRDFVFAAWGTAGGGYGGVFNVYYDSTSGKTSYSLARTYASNTWPSTLSGKTTTTSRQYSIYGLFGYAFPVMVGTSSSLPASANVQYTVPTATNDSAWSTTVASNEALHTGTVAFGDLAVSLNTAPGGSTVRAIGPYVNGNASGVLTSLTTTSGQDVIDAYYTVANDRISMANVPTGTPAASTPNRWRLQVVADSQPITAKMSAATSANRLCGIQDDSGVAGTAIEQVMPESGTLKTFRARMNGTLTSGSYTLTLVKNSVDTAVVITLDSTNQEASYTATTISVATGDRLYWKCVPATPNASRQIMLGCLYDSDTPGNGILLGSNNVNASNSATVYNNWYGSGAWNATESNVQALAEYVQFTKLYVLLSAAPTTGKNRLVALRQNGVTTAASVTIADAATTGTWTGTVNVNRDDLINVIQTPSGTPTGATVKYGLVYNYGTAWTPRVRWM